MAIVNSRRPFRPDSRSSRDSRALSWASTEPENCETRAIKDELNDIRLSLDYVSDHLISQQCIVTRELEDKARHVYDEVINDINEVRKRVNLIGDTFAAPSKFKTWIPAAPFRKEILQNIYEIKKPTKLKSSKSVDFLDIKDSDKIDKKRSNQNPFRWSWLGSSNSSIDSRSSSRSRSSVPGYGCCFNGDSKTIPYRSYTPSYGRTSRHSWGPSRSGSRCPSRSGSRCPSGFGSRSTLDDDDYSDAGDRSPMCGMVPDDWRVKVAPYMWDGWPLPGLDRNDVIKQRERMEIFEVFRLEAVTVHNEYRRQHGCPDLSVSDELARDSQQWAEILAGKGYAQYSDSQSRGENILVVDIEDYVSGRQVMDTWYREGKHYNYKQPRWQRGTSNFTQMIWKSSQHIGVGIAKFPYHDTYVIVVQYQPPGNTNTPGQFRKNVPIPKLDGHPKEKARLVTATTDIVNEHVKDNNGYGSLTKESDDETPKDAIAGKEPEIQLCINHNELDYPSDDASVIPITASTECLDEEVSKLKGQLKQMQPDTRTAGHDNVKDKPISNVTAGKPLNELGATNADVRDILDLLDQITQGADEAEGPSEEIELLLGNRMSARERTESETNHFPSTLVDSKSKDLASSSDIRKSDVLAGTVDSQFTLERRNSTQTDV